MAHALIVGLLVIALINVTTVSSNPTGKRDDEYSGTGGTIMLLKRLMAMAPSKQDLILPGAKKRTCYFNAGMSLNCDYKELVGAVDEANYWSSEQTPGRRRRRSDASRNTPDSQTVF